jgi:Protein of unknown function (DUF3574)
LLAACALLSACTTVHEPACEAATGNPMRVYQLYFGRNIKSGGFVSDQDWSAFQRSVITRELPDGYTILDAEGAWAAPNGQRTMTDPTKVVIVALPIGPAGLAAATRTRLEYQRQFSQDLVGMISYSGCGLF